MTAFPIVGAAELAGAALVLAGLAVLLVAAAPARMTIEARSTRFAVGTILLFAGTMVVARVQDPANAGALNGLVCLGVLGVGVSLLAKFGLRRRLRSGRLDWERKWQHLEVPAPLRSIIRRYLDVD